MKKKINEVYEKLMGYPKEEIALRLAHMICINEEDRERMRNNFKSSNEFVYEYPCDENEVMHHL